MTLVILQLKSENIKKWKKEYALTTWDKHVSKKDNKRKNTQPFHTITGCNLKKIDMISNLTIILETQILKLKTKYTISPEYLQQIYKEISENKELANNVIKDCKEPYKTQLENFLTKEVFKTN